MGLISKDLVGKWMRRTFLGAPSLLLHSFLLSLSLPLSHHLSVYLPLAIYLSSYLSLSLSSFFPPSVFISLPTLTVNFPRKKSMLFLRLLLGSLYVSSVNCKILTFFWLSVVHFFFTTDFTFILIRH